MLLLEFCNGVWDQKLEWYNKTFDDIGLHTILSKRYQNWPDGQTYLSINITRHYADAWQKFIETQEKRYHTLKLEMSRVKKTCG